MNGESANTGYDTDSAMPRRDAGKVRSGGSRSSGAGMKLGVSHQKPEQLTDEHLNYLKQMGVEWLKVTA